MHRSSSLEQPLLNSTLIGILAGLIAAFIWGLWPVITRHGVTTEFSPEAIVVVRFIFAGVALAPFYFSRKVYQRISIFRSLILATTAGAIYVYVSALGLKFVPAGHLGVVETGTMLALSALGGYYLLHEKKTSRQIIGYLLVFSGMIIINWQSLLISDENVIYGDLLLVLGGVLWATYTILSKKWNLNSWDAVIAVSFWSLITWVPLIIIYSDISFTTQTLISWLIQGVSQGLVAGILGLWCYSLAVQQLGAARGALFGSLVPAIASIGGFVFLSEVPTNYEIIGVILTTIGITISLKAKRI